MNYTGEVCGTAADIQLELKYQNKIEKSVEAVFTFPLMPEASVTDVQLFIGDKVVNAELRERNEARKEYDDARDQGHLASLLEEERSNIFTMSVGGIEPGEELRVALRYMQRVEWQNGGGRFTLPMVVAPRFIPGDSLGRNLGGGWSPDTDRVPDASKITPKVAENISYQASVSLKVTPGFEAFLACPSHDALLSAGNLEATEARKIELNGLHPDRDFTITYQNLERESSIAVDTAQFAGKDREVENFAMLQLVPPLSSVNAARDRDIVLCLDRSGSMDGLAIDGLRKVTKRLIENLSKEPGDIRLGIVLFDHEAEVLCPLQPLDDIEKILREVQTISARGGTELDVGLEQALSLHDLRSEGMRERSVVLVTDGETMSYNFNNRGIEGIRIHSVGISSAVDRAVLKEIAERTGGSTYWICPGEDYDVAARELLSRTAGPLVSKLRLEGIGGDIEVLGGDVLWNGQPQTLYVRLPRELPREFQITGLHRDGSVYSEVVNTSDYSSFDAVPKLWAREYLRTNPDHTRATDVSLTYGVLGGTTAFVAVSEKQVPGEKPERIDIPVSLPHGWEMEPGWLGMQKGISSRIARGGQAMYLGAMDAELVFEASCDLFDFEVDVAAPDPDLTPSTTHPSLLERVERFFSEGQHLSESGESLWQKLVEDIEVESAFEYEDWTAAQKAKLFHLLAELRGFGYRVELSENLRERPVNDTVAFEYWTKAQRSLGIHVNP